MNQFRLVLAQFLQGKLAPISHELSQSELKNLQLELNPSWIRAELSSDTSLVSREGLKSCYCSLWAPPHTISNFELHQHDVPQKITFFMYIKYSNSKTLYCFWKNWKKLNFLFCSISHRCIFPNIIFQKIMNLPLNHEKKSILRFRPILNHPSMQS